MLEYYIDQLPVKSFSDEKAKKKYIAKIKQRPLVPAKRLFEKAAFGNTISQYEIGLAMDELFDAAVFELEHGRPVQLGRFGTLRVRLEAEGKDSADEVTLKSVKKKIVTFIPSKELTNHIKNLPLQKIKYTRREVK